MTRPRVVVSSAGVFHAYHLARGAQQAGYLQRFITTIYSRYETGIDRRKVQQIRTPAIIAQLLSSLPGEKARPNSSYVGDNLYDRLQRRHVEDAAIFPVFKTPGLHSILDRLPSGALTIAQRS